MYVCESDCAGKSLIFTIYKIYIYVYILFFLLHIISIKSSKIHAFLYNILNSCYFRNVSLICALGSLSLHFYLSQLCFLLFIISYFILTSYYYYLSLCLSGTIDHWQASSGLLIGHRQALQL